MLKKLLIHLLKGEKNLKQIDKYVNSVYQNASGNKKAIEELKLEMKNHLLEAVNDLKEFGKTEQEAIDIAIERFGEEKEIRSVVAQLFKAQKAFAKWVLYVGIVILLLSTAVFGYFLNIGNERTSVQSEIAYGIGDIIENDAEVSQVTEKQIKQLLNDASYIKNVTVFLDDDKTEPIYELDRNTGENFSLVYNKYSYGSDNSFVEIGFIDYRDIGFVLLFFGLTCFGVLFFIWLAINVYHKRKRHSLI